MPFGGMCILALLSGSRWMAMPPYRGVKLQLPQSLRSGHQLAIRLLDFDTPEGDASHGLSGVELRIFLEPFKSPPSGWSRTRWIGQTILRVEASPGQWKMR